MKTSMFNKIKKEIAFQLSRFIAIKVKKGILKRTHLYGDLFFNRRAEELSLEERFYASINHEDFHVIEAGAYIGTLTILFSKIFSLGKIYAFEPNPLNYKFLKMNLKRNRCHNVVAENMGLSSSKSILPFIAKRYIGPTGSFNKNKQNSLKKTTQPLISMQIQVCSIDEYIKAHNLDKLDFVKIDTEGFETEVLAGMKQTFYLFAPIIYIEIHGHNANERSINLRQVFDILKENNYNLKKIDGDFPIVSKENIGGFDGGAFAAYPESKKKMIENIFFAQKNMLE